MKERPILMRGPLVCATLEDRKTETRRICKPACSKGIWADGAHPARDGMPIFWWNIIGGALADRAEFTQRMYATGMPCPYGAIGDRLWVRETFSIVPTTAYRASTGVQQTINPCDPDDAAIYRAGWDRSDPGTRWRPSIHMPRWASRLTLEITGVRVERLHRIGEASAKAEGVDPKPVVSVARGESYLSYCEAFSDLWDTTTTNPAHRWAANPFVWVLTYRRIAQPPAALRTQNYQRAANGA